jgi:hypothetical protein
MNKIIPVETKVKVMEGSLQLSDVEEIAARYGVSPGAVYYWFNHKVKPAFGEILKNDPPGPERKTEAPVEQNTKRPSVREVAISVATPIFGRMAHIKLSTGCGY